jgi:hypothetical protein
VGSRKGYKIFREKLERECHFGQTHIWEDIIDKKKKKICVADIFQLP